MQDENLDLDVLLGLILADSSKGFFLKFCVLGEYADIECIFSFD
jgi:hypothetical protein